MAKKVEAVKAWGGAWSKDHPPHEWAFALEADARKVVRPDKPIRVRIIREADYRRLLRAAKRRG